MLIRDSNQVRARQLFRHFPEITIWWSTPVEIESAVARLIRKARITEEEQNGIELQVKKLQGRWREILPEQQVRQLAIDCLQRYRIRSADALQLGAALTWCKEIPRGRPFVCFNSELSEAARQAGFKVYG